MQIYMTPLTYTSTAYSTPYTNKYASPTLNMEVCMRLRNKSNNVKIQTADGTITPVLSLFHVNPCHHFNESDFIFMNEIAMGPLTHQVLASPSHPHTLRCVLTGERVDAMEILSNVEHRDNIIECVGSALAGLFEQMIEDLKIPSS